MNGKWKFSWNISSQHNMCSDSNDTIDFRIWFWLAYLILLAMVLILKILHVLSDPICCLNDTIWHLIKSYTVLNTLKRHQVVFKFYIQQKKQEYLDIWLLFLCRKDNFSCPTRTRYAEKNQTKQNHFIMAVMSWRICHRYVYVYTYMTHAHTFKV